MLAIITSASDIASMTIRNQLLRNYGFSELKEKFNGFPVFNLQIEEEDARLYTLSSRHVDCDSLDEQIPASMFVFASRHYSKAGIPALTTHSVGNWAKAGLGGRDFTICPTSPALMKLFLQNLDAAAKSEGYSGDIVQESTHHGPFISKPAVFIELGSTEKEWRDEKLASLVADCLVGGLGDFVVLENDSVPVMGIGGLHYATNFRKLMVDSNYAVGHICPKHHLASLTPEILKQAMDSCGAKKLALDWKGMGKEKERVKRLAANFDFFRV